MSKQKRFHTYEYEQEQLLKWQRLEYFGIPIGQFDEGLVLDYEKQSYINNAHLYIMLGEELPQEIEDKLYEYGLGVGPRNNLPYDSRFKDRLYMSK